MITLGLESTCDESCAALVSSPRDILCNVVKSQIEDHRTYGGVVPEIAARLHLAYLPPALEQCLNKAKKTLDDIDLIAVSSEPGLLGGLLVGTTIAKTLSLLLNKPMVCVDHLFGHLMAPDLQEEMVFPSIAGVFSGAHSNVYVGHSPLKWECLARSRDDAPGEAFDKTAKLLDLSYPGGPAIDRFAKEGEEDKFKLPLPLPRSLDGDFSFSGLKTAILYHIKGTQGKKKCDQSQWADLAASFQFTVAQALSKRLIQAAEQHNCEHIYVGGGVAANSRLRSYLEEQCQTKGMACHFPPLSLCIDNAAMIAHAGRLLYENGHRSALNSDVKTRSHWGRTG